MGDEGGVRERSKVSCPGPLRIGRKQFGGHLKDEPRLAAPPGPREGEKPGAGEEALDLCDLLRPPTKLVR